MNNAHTEPPGGPPENTPGKPPEARPARRGRPENLHRGPAPGVERGPDGRLRRKEQPAAPSAEGAADEGPVGPVTPSEMLRDAKWVYQHDDEGRDTTPGRRTMRKQLKDDLAKFLALYRQLQHDHRLEKIAARKAGQAAAPPAPDRPDEGTRRAMELCDRLLEEEP